MFELTLHYPENSRARGAQETVRSSFVPQIGSGIYSDRYYNSEYRVANVTQAIVDGILSDRIDVILAIDED